jgi:hypothetical protein
MTPGGCALAEVPGGPRADAGELGEALSGGGTAFTSAATACWRRSSICLFSASASCGFE